MSVSFLEVAADWADARHVDIAFQRDTMDGWFAVMRFTDSRSPFSATVNEVPAQKKDIGGDYRAKVYSLLSRAAAKAHASRIGGAIRHAKAA